MKKALATAAGSLALVVLAGCSSGDEAQNQVAAETNLANAMEASNLVANSEAPVADTAERAEPEPAPAPAEKVRAAPAAQPRSAPKAAPAKPKVQTAPEPKVEPKAPDPTCLPEHRAAGHC